MFDGVKKKAIFVFAALLFLIPSGFTEPLKAPSFNVQDIQGNPQSLEKYAGKPLILYFWATWCPACRQEVENMGDVYRQFYPKGVQFVSVSLDQDLERLRNFVQDKKIPYPVLFDGLGWKNEVARLYEVEATPAFYVINPQGFIETGGSWSSDLTEALHKYS